MRYLNDLSHLVPRIVRCFLFISISILFLAACTRKAPNDILVSTVSTASIDTPVPVKIIDGEPLTIYIAEDASYQIDFHNGDGSLYGQVYPPFAKNADSGLFVTHGNDVIGPNFEEDFRITVANIYDPWEPIGQSDLTGSGIQTDPWIIHTYLSHSSGITMTSHTSYINGDNFFTIEWDICSSGPAQISTFIAADFSLIGENAWNGFFDNPTKSVGATNIEQNWSESFGTGIDPTHYIADESASVWNAIGSQGSPGSGFNDTLKTNQPLLAAGLQWDLSVTDCATLQAQWCVGPDGTCPPPVPVDHDLFIPFIHR